MNIDINLVLQKAQARIGELEMQLIIAQTTIEQLQKEQEDKNHAKHEQDA